MVARTRPGLSLCIQGTLACSNGSEDASRFIPVYTGNTRRYTPGQPASPVYPCVYREHLRFVLMGSTERGLSLCIQGTQRFNHLYIRKFRFIPVYTGNTHRFLLLCCSYTVYPCVYREHSSISLASVGKSGLSLCIQGTHRTRGIHSKRWRFIPVYTGNTTP